MRGQNSFLEITRSLRLYVPQLPIPLAQQFIRDRYRRMLSARDWSGTRREAEFLLSGMKSDGSVDVIRNDVSVIGNGTTFDADDVGRQFKCGTGSPIYTVTAVDVGAQELTLDRVYGVTTAVAQSYYIIDAYLTPPDDFMRFTTIVDPLQGWQLRHWVTQQELNAMDPQRTFFGNPYLLADKFFNNATAGSSEPKPMYEAWPYNSGTRTLYYNYIIRVPDLIQDADVPVWPINTDVLVSGALADVARWPGTPDVPNLYYSRPEYWKSYEMDYNDKMITLERQDEDVYSTMLQQWPYSQFNQVAPMSANWIMSHAI